jgi:DNA-nicking Smr family endonuclease
MNKSSKISDEDKKLFRDAVGNTKPIKDNNVITEKSKPSPYPKKNEENYVNSDYEINENELNEKLVDGKEEIRFCSAGENDKKFKRLRQGKYKFENKLDLHGMQAKEAKKELAMFLEECKLRSVSCVLIIHGKGYGSKNNSPVIKNKLNQWLRNHSMVWGFCSAQPSDGGTGAVYVYFKKN